MAATLNEYEKDLANGIHRSIAPEMAKLTDGNGINALVDRVATRIEAMIERNWPRPPAAKLLACRAGCAFCCNQCYYNQLNVEMRRQKFPVASGDKVSPQQQEMR